MKPVAVIAAAALLLLFGASGMPAPAKEQVVVERTFHKDVLPIIQARCQECHRPGEAGPMPLRAYEEVRPWALRIREMVSSRRMPPWFSDDPPGRFANDRRLSTEELRTILDWIAAGAPEGDPRDAPPSPVFATGWAMGEPDTIVALPGPFEVPAQGVVEYHYVLIPIGFTEDRWVQAIEVRPSDRAVVHHIQAFVRPPTSQALRDRPLNEFWPDEGCCDLPDEDDGVGVIVAAGDLEQVCVYVPGGLPCVLSDGQARLIPAGSDLYLILHYQTVGMATRDQTRIGFRFADRAPRERVRNFFLANHGFRIPPGAPHHEVSAEVTLARPARLISMMPHMHLRGKAFHFELVYPDGRTERILNVPHYDPHWQLTYYFAEPLDLPPGTRIIAVGIFDNSAGNPHNPDPTKEVRWGLQSWEEMHTGFFDLAFPADMPPDGLFQHKVP